MAAIEGIKVVLNADDQLSFVIKRAGEVLREFAQNAKSTAESTKKLENNSNALSTKFRHLVEIGGQLRFVMYDIRDIFSATFGVVIKSSSQIERMTVLMEGLSTATNKTAREAEALSSKNFVFSLSKNSPFEVNALSDSFVKLKSAGIDPTNGSLQTMVDSVAKFGGSSETLKRATVAIQQMSGKGVISMEELRQQLGEAVPSAMRAMATGTGMSMGELVKVISKGTVEAQSALQRMFAVLQFDNEGAANAFVKTWQGQMERLKTNITLIAAQIGGGGAFEQLTKDLTQLNDFFQSNDGKKFADEIGQSIKQVVSLASSAVKLAVEYSAEIKKLGQVLAIIWGARLIKSAIVDLTQYFTRYFGLLSEAIAKEKIVQQTKLAQLKAAAIAEAESNAQSVTSAASAAAARTASMQAQYAAQMELRVAFNAQADALDAKSAARKSI
jgi:tape measure domain-containing protein